MSYVQNSSFDFHSYKVVSSSDFEKKKTQRFASILNFLQGGQVRRSEMLHFVTSYTNQNKKCKQTLRSAQYGLEIIFEANAYVNDLID